MKKAGFKAEFKSTNEEPKEFFSNKVLGKSTYNPIALMTYELFSSKIGDAPPRIFIMKTNRDKDKSREFFTVGSRSNVGFSKIALDFSKQEE